ncbi:MAG: hypothetical protein Q8920_13415 [Bacillota bacterium]|nr:hypothetical protein [Bacillota bacterium]
MNKIKNIVLYSFAGWRKSTLLLSAIIIAIGLLSKGLAVSFNGSRNMHSEFSGFEITLGIFIFVGFIACFKNNFNHLNIMGVTRKTFFKGHLLFIAAAAVSMLVLYGVLAGIYMLAGVKVQTLTSQVYWNVSFFHIIIFTLSLFILASTAGWLISLLCYKYGTPMIITLAVSPAILLMIIPILSNILHLGNALWAVINFYFALNSHSSLLASLNFASTAVVFAFCSWLLIRKLPVKV